MGWVWGKYEQNVLAFEQETYMLCFAVKWQGQKRVLIHALPDYPRYKRSPQDDTALIKELWRVFNEADIIVAHNGDAFDIKTSNARFLFRSLPPPKPYQTIDTLKIARRRFKLNSNKLDDIAKTLKLGRKFHTGGFKLWQDCMRGQRTAWERMKRYNKQDVVLLEKVYEKLKPWAPTHPNLTLYKEETDRPACPRCLHPEVHKYGWYYTPGRKTKQYKCKKCYSVFRDFK